MKKQGMRKPKLQFRQQSGFTLLEIVIAMLLLAVGLVGAALLQTNAKRSSFDALQRSMATAIANDMIVRMRSNVPLLAGESLAEYNGIAYGQGSELPEPENRCQSIAAPCQSFSQIRMNDLYEWDQLLRGKSVTLMGKTTSGLLNPVGCIDFNQGVLKVVVAWQGKNKVLDAAANEDADGFAASCGEASELRRQVTLESYIY
jgi:type IV pilus assembly protein PilV